MKAATRSQCLFLALLLGAVFTVLFHADHLGEQLRGLWQFPQVLPLLLFEGATFAFATLVAYLIIRAYQRDLD